MKFLVYRDNTDDGVIGLNGKQWLLDDDGNAIEFDLVDKAVQFLNDHGVDIYIDDLMHIVDSEDDQYTDMVEHFFEHKNCVAEHEETE